MHWGKYDNKDYYRMSKSQMAKMFGDAATDVYEKDNNVVVKMNLPGIAAKDVDISIDNGTLYVTAERIEEEEEDKKDYYYQEIRTGTFERSVKLPEDVDEDAAMADFSDGVLMMIFPKMRQEPEKGRRKRISINKR